MRASENYRIFCNDLRLLASGPRAGPGEIRLPERAAGSLNMPTKVNPVIPEVVNRVCFKAIDNDVALTFAAKAGQLQLNVMEPVIGQTMFESCAHRIFPIASTDTMSAHERSRKWRNCTSATGR